MKRHVVKFFQKEMKTSRSLPL